MATLELDNIHKSYGKHVALKGVSLSVGDGEFFVILGPSGAGKTTTLKSVAGLQDIDDGVVRIDGVDMDGVEPYLRNVGMAFESYALYPQDTVFQNLASPLRSGRFGTYSAAQQRDRIQQVTASLGIDLLLERYPRELSNGQRQRVALGRVLVRPAGIYLLDEPLSHLDAKLRATMRSELKSLGAMSRTTTLYVTHDYQEALALGDKIAVLRAGSVVQVGTPQEIWRQPRDVFVARALGQPEMNLIPATVDGGHIVAAGGALRIAAPQHLDLGTGDRLLLGIRPREVALTPGDAAIQVEGVVQLAELLGRAVELAVAVGDTEVIAVVPSEGAPREDDRVRLTLPLDLVLVFAAKDGIPEDDAPLLGSLAAPKEDA